MIKHHRVDARLLLSLICTEEFFCFSDGICECNPVTYGKRYLHAVDTLTRSSTFFCVRRLVWQAYDRLLIFLVKFRGNADLTESRAPHRSVRNADHSCANTETELFLHTRKRTPCRFYCTG